MMASMCENLACFLSEDHDDLIGFRKFAAVPASENRKPAARRAMSVDHGVPPLPDNENAGVSVFDHGTRPPVASVSSKTCSRTWIEELKVVDASSFTHAELDSLVDSALRRKLADESRRRLEEGMVKLRVHEERKKREWELTKQLSLEPPTCARKGEIDVLPSSANSPKKVIDIHSARDGVEICTCSGCSHRNRRLAARRIMAKSSACALM